MLWLQSQGSLVRVLVLPNTGYTCNLRRISYKIMFMVFLLFPLIQERQFLVISESICTLDHFVLVNCLEGLSLSARRSGLSRSFNCIAGIHRPRMSQSDLLVHARDSRNPKPIHAEIPVMLRRCNLLISHKPTHSYSCSAISNGMKSQYNCLHIAETNSGQFRGMKWCILGMHLNEQSPVLKATHGHYMTEMLSQRFAR